VDHEQVADWEKLSPETQRDIMEFLPGEGTPEERLARERADEWKESDMFLSWPLVYCDRNPRRTKYEFLPVDPFMQLPLFRWEWYRGTQDGEDWWNTLWLVGHSHRHWRDWKKDTPAGIGQVCTQLTAWECGWDLYLGARRRFELAQDKTNLEKPEFDASASRARVEALIQVNALDLPVPETAVEARALRERLEAEYQTTLHSEKNYALPFWWSESGPAEQSWQVFGGLLAFGRESEHESSFRLLGWLARNRRHYEKSEFRILEYIYAEEHDRGMSQYTVFPFISYRSDSNGEVERTKFSFLWRMFDRENVGGEVSGHILFIPYGK